MLRRRSFGTHSNDRSIHTALQAAADQAQRRRRVLRWGLIVLGGALLVFGLLLLGNPT
jgi:uncharacterized membrane protein HdeD (DUF308 family)